MIILIAYIKKDDKTFMIAKDIIDNLMKVYEFTLSELNQLTKELSNVDIEIQSLLHYVEFNKFDVVSGYKIVRNLKDLRIKRRGIKNELEPLQILLSSLEKCDLNRVNEKIKVKLEKIADKQNFLNIKDVLESDALTEMACSKVFR